MILEIDQSGRVEETNKPTVIGVSNGQSYSLMIDAKEKRSILAHLKEFKPKWIGPRGLALVFAELVCIALEAFDTKEVDLIVIDLEYPGYEVEIRDRLLSRLRRRGMNTKQIVFQSIGKSSNSHAVASKTFKRILLANLKINANQFFGRLRK